MEDPGALDGAEPGVSRDGVVTDADDPVGGLEHFLGPDEHFPVVLPAFELGGTEDV